MATLPSPRAGRARQSRKSIAHPPSADLGGDKENATMDLAALPSFDLQSKEKAKKSRSKSIGPGGLDALKQGNGNKTPPRQVKSILKTTIALSPPKVIPPRIGSRVSSPGKSGEKRTPDKSAKRSPGRTTPSKVGARTDGVSGKSPQSASRSPTRIALRTEEEQEEAARERARQEEIARKDARRKSLAARRVSFAPEATLHTWNVVEMPEDSTTSSASTNSTRRASALDGSPYAASGSAMPSSDASEPPSTPPEQVEELQVSASPAHQRDLHQKKRRRSSAVPPPNFNDPSEFSSSPASAQSDESGTQTFEAADEGVDESSDSADDEDVEEDETVRSADGDDTMQSNGKNSTSSSGRLEAALELAAKQAGTQGIDYDEHGDITMEMADDEVTNAFQPFLNQNQRIQQGMDHSKAMLDQENLNPFSPAFKANISAKQQQEDETAAMEMTQAVGGILPKSEELQSSPKKRKARKSVIGSRRRSSVARRRSSGDASNMDEEETMELTMAIGGIQAGPVEPQDPSIVNEDEELTMEFTSVVGGVVHPDGPNQEQASNQESNDNAGLDMTLNEADMDMTFAAGGILAPISEITEPLEDATMDVTTAIGSILPEQLSTGNKVEAKHLMELEADAGQLTGSPFHNGFAQKPMGAGLADERPLPAQLHKTAVASETGSPSIVALQSRSAGRKSLAPRQAVSPGVIGKSNTPVKKVGTPTKQLTPQAIRPTTPGKTPPSKNVTMRTSSPKKLFKSEIKAGNSAKKADDGTPKSDFKNPLFRKDSITGATTPSVILKPKKRRSSGLGIDREGLGSPQVTEKLDRRASIGDTAKAFVPGDRGLDRVRFEDPQIMEQEIDHERAENQRRESSRGIMEGEADDQIVEDENVTANLKDMISSLTPQRNKLKGRKSLHVGAAKGILGKRPAELDEDEESDATPKRLKGREGSPVKKVKLPAPPPKSATTGRITRSSRLSLAETAGNARSSTPVGVASPPKGNNTPKDQSRFRDAEGQSPAQVQPFKDKVEGQGDAAEPAEEDDQIHLQDFLNMTSIRFMELTTTKRRHTIAPNAAVEASAKKPDRASGDNETDEKADLESCVVAAACTVPMLELYQHSCRELKNYISEGRNIVKEIEADTYEDNPLLFREYLMAPTDIKLIMDNQFKNVKTNARLLSKAMWYEWRMKLLDGLKEGFIKIGDEMEQDDQCLIQQEQIIQPVLPGLIEEHDRLESQVQLAQSQADELADCDQDELKYARETLDSLDQELEAKQKLVEELQNELREKEDALESVVARKQECLDEIKEADKILQDCRGWSPSEVATLQANVNRLESTHGWTITAATPTTLTMTYARTLQLYFSPPAFLPLPTSTHPSPSKAPSSKPTQNAPISLTYTPSSQSTPLTTPLRFFLQIIQSHLQCLHQPSTPLPHLLAFISSSWASATEIADEIAGLERGYITEARIVSDEGLRVECSVLLREMRTRVVVGFEVGVGMAGGKGEEGGKGEGVEVTVKASARVVYGEALKEGRMGEFVQGKVEGGGGWVEGVRELEVRCVARGRK